MTITKEKCLMADGSEIPFERQIEGPCPGEGFVKVINKMRGNRVEWIKPECIAREAQKRINEAAGNSLASFHGHDD
jgi:hypothetical protein